jgi:hypothetical protein
MLLRYASSNSLTSILKWLRTPRRSPLAVLVSQLLRLRLLLLQKRQRQRLPLRKLLLLRLLLKRQRLSNHNALYIRIPYHYRDAGFLFFLGK